MLRVVLACTCADTSFLSTSRVTTMFQMPVELALDYTQQLIATRLGHEPTRPPITLAMIREQIGIPTEVSDREIVCEILAVAFKRIRQG